MAAPLATIPSQSTVWLNCCYTGKGVWDDKIVQDLTFKWQITSIEFKFKNQIQRVEAKVRTPPWGFGYHIRKPLTFKVEHSKDDTRNYSHIEVSPKLAQTLTLVARLQRQSFTNESVFETPGIKVSIRRPAVVDTQETKEINIGLTVFEEFAPDRCYGIQIFNFDETREVITAFVTDTEKEAFLDPQKKSQCDEDEYGKVLDGTIIQSSDDI